MKQFFSGVVVIVVLVFTSALSMAEQRLILSDDFSGSLTTNWTLGRSANQGTANTLAIVDERLKWNQKYDYIESKLTFGNDVLVQFDLSVEGGSTRAGDFWVEFVSLTDNEDYTAGIFRSKYGISFKDDRINIGRAPSLLSSQDADDVESPSYLKLLPESGDRVGTLTFVHAQKGVQVRFENETGDVISSSWVSTGSFTTTKIRVWGSGADRYIDNVKVYEPSETCDVATNETTLMSPSGATENTPLNFIWDENTCATWYKLWVGTPGGDKAFAGWYDAAEKCSNGSCSITPALNLSNGSYEWYIKSWNEDSSEWSDGMSFTIQSDNTSPSKVTPSSPSGNTQVLTPIYTWTEDPASTYYKVWVGSSTGEKVMSKWYDAAEICSDGICSATFEQTLSIGSYEWYIKSWNEYGRVWNDGMSFTVTSGSGHDGSGTCDNSDITLTIGNDTETLSLLIAGGFSGFERGTSDQYSCVWNSDDSQLLINGLSGTITDGTTFVMSDSDPSHLSLIWNSNIYILTDFTLTFTTWDGPGGDAIGKLSATFQSFPLNETITITDVELCAPIVD